MHDYEPDMERKPHPMSSEPPCRICGANRKDVSHRPHAVEVIGQHVPQPDGSGGKFLRR